MAMDIAIGSSALRIAFPRKSIRTVILISLTFFEDESTRCGALHHMHEGAA